MTHRAFACGVWAAAVLCFGAVADAQTNRTAERFTFMTVNPAKAGLSETDRLPLTINRWSTDAEREQVLAAFKEGGEQRLADAISQMPELGYIEWPGHLQYVVRYAIKRTVPDGEEVILGLDQRAIPWWDTTNASEIANRPRFTIVQFRLSKDGRGEGKLTIGANVTMDESSKVVTLDDWTKHSTVITDIARERINNS